MKMPSGAQPLSAQDLIALEQSFITPELAKQAQLFRVDSVAGATLIGRNGSGDYSGIVFHTVGPATTRRGIIGCDAITRTWSNSLTGR